MVMDVEYVGEDEISKATMSNTLRKKRKKGTKAKRKKGCGCK
jgi:hypothetical protein